MAIPDFPDEETVVSVRALKLKPIIAEKAKENILSAQNNNSASAHQKSDKQVNTARELAKVAGVSHDTIHRVEFIENNGSEETKEKARSNEISINEAYNIVKKQEDAKKREANIETQIQAASESIDINSPQKKYKVVYADPPWSYSDKQNNSNMGGAEKHYPTMPLSDICNLPVKELTEENAVLFLWIPSKSVTVSR